MRVVDAVVIGSGPNGLVSAIALADAGWDVLVLEAADEFGGAVRSTTVDGWVSDRFSSSYPLGVASPVLRALELERFGLRWAHAPLALAHLLDPDDQDAAAIHPDPADTAASVGRDHPKDGDAWLRLYQDYVKIRAPFLQSLLTSWPPVAPGLRLARKLGSAGELARFARFMAMPVHRMGQELFEGPRGRALLAGNAFHADAPLSGSVSGTMGWLLAMLAQDVGFPVAEGGSGSLSSALVRRAEHAGADLIPSTPITAIDVSAGKVTAVRTAGGETIAVRRAVIADVSAQALYGELLPPASIPAGLRRDLENFEWDYPTVKLNYRLSGPIPWRAAEAREAGVVHLGGTADELVHVGADLDTGRLPTTPFLLIGQTTKADASRSPAGTEAVWAYSHLPRGVADDASAEKLAGRMDRAIERHAPGFLDLVIARDLQRPSDFVHANASLGLGALGGGTAQLHQQLIFRPTIGLGSPRTVVSGLYLGSSAIHPGPGVHGACGYLAARAALRDASLLGPLTRIPTTAALRHLQR
ncbi:phytoene desaturase family protein [Kribbella catacumbae]|uniref:phytoene desaturase family protein n=1 Tax=Kribbella catacumbae TaxID=460086 RepID=UPI00036594F5|nr:NAD(P)/FAD-dependent oxidoreductase [Kribbella catacumbae]